MTRYVPLIIGPAPALWAISPELIDLTFISGFGTVIMDNAIAVLATILLIIFILQNILIYLSNPKFLTSRIEGEVFIEEARQEAIGRKKDTLSLLAIVLAIITFALGDGPVGSQTSDLVLPFSLCILFLLISLVAGKLYIFRIASEIQAAGNTYALGSLLVGLLFVLVSRIGSPIRNPSIEESLTYFCIGLTIILIILLGIFDIMGKINDELCRYFTSLNEEEKKKIIKNNKQKFVAASEKDTESTQNQLVKFVNKIKFLLGLLPLNWREIRVQLGLKSYFKIAREEDIANDIDLLYESDSNSSDNSPKTGLERGNE